MHPTPSDPFSHLVKPVSPISPSVLELSLALGDRVNLRGNQKPQPL